MGRRCNRNVHLERETEIEEMWAKVRHLLSTKNLQPAHPRCLLFPINDNGIRRFAEVVI